MHAQATQEVEEVQMTQQIELRIPQFDIICPHVVESTPRASGQAGIHALVLLN